MTYKAAALLALMALLTIGCGSDDASGLNAQIAAAEKAVEQANDPQQAEALLGLYRAYVDQHPDDHTQNGHYLYRSASVRYRMGQHQAALALLEEGLRHHFEGGHTPELAMFMGHILADKLGQNAVALTVWQLMPEVFPKYKKMDEVRARLANFNPPPAPVEERLEALMGKAAYDDGRLNVEAAKDFIRACEVHALLRPASPKAPLWLHKAADMARATRQFPKALDLYQWIAEGHPDYEKTAQVMFIHAFTLDNDLQRYDEAKAAYEAFLQRFPDDDFADDTAILLQNLGKSEEEILRSFGVQ